MYRTAGVRVLLQKVQVLSTEECTFCELILKHTIKTWNTLLWTLSHFSLKWVHSNSLNFIQSRSVSLHIESHFGHDVTLSLPFQMYTFHFMNISFRMTINTYSILFFHTSNKLRMWMMFFRFYPNKNTSQITNWAKQITVWGQKSQVRSKHLETALFDKLGIACSVLNRNLICLEVRMKLWWVFCLSFSLFIGTYYKL